MVADAGKIVNGELLPAQVWVPEPAASQGNEDVQQPHNEQHDDDHARDLRERGRQWKLREDPPDQREDDADNENRNE
jgi:hypothetical protein